MDKKEKGGVSGALQSIDSIVTRWVEMTREIHKIEDPAERTIAILALGQIAKMYVKEVIEESVGDTFPLPFPEELKKNKTKVVMM